MLVDNVDIENFEGDGEQNLCPHCGWHWYEKSASATQCEGCQTHVSPEELVSEREFAGLDRPYVEVSQVDEKRKNRQGFLLVFAIIFVFVMFSSFAGTCSRPF